LPISRVSLAWGRRNDVDVYIHRGKEKMQTFESLFTRNFVLAFIAQLAFTSIIQLLIPTFPIYLQKLGSTEIEIGALVGVLGLASMVARPLVGRALMKMREKTFMVAGSIIFTIGSIGYLLVPPFWPLLLVRFFQGVGFGCFHTASTTYVVSISAVENRARIIGYFALTMNIAGAIAPPVGVILISRFGPNHLFLVCSAVSLCMLLVSACLGRSPVLPTHDSVTEKIVLLNRKALPPSVIGSLGLFVWASLTTFFPLYALKQGVANPGLFFTVMAIMLILSRVLGGRIFDVPDKRIVILPCIVGFVVAMVLLSFSRTQPMFLIVAAIWGVGHAFLMPSLITYALERAGTPAGPVVGTFYAVADVGTFVGPLCMGVVLRYTNYPTMFLSLAGIGIISLSYFLFFSRRKGG
jgi:MFS family permease